MEDLFKWFQEILIATAMGFAIGVVYWRLHRGFNYSATFVQTCVLTVVLCSVIAKIVADSSYRLGATGPSTALAFALVGMLGLIRFRTVVRDTREFTFLFLAITAGIAIGSHDIGPGVGGSIIALTILYFMGKTNFGSTKTAAYRIKVQCPSHNQDAIENCLRNLGASFEFVSAKVNDDLQYTYQFDVVTDERKRQGEAVQGV
ncbi:hypothetical protein GFPCMMHI_01105 [Ensifer adhaerens]|nr:hypothetical protein [Ensifer adhaerens]